MPKLDKLPKQKQANRYIHLLKIKKSLDLQPRREKKAPRRPQNNPQNRPQKYLEDPHVLFWAPKDAMETRRKDIHTPLLQKVCWTRNSCLCAHNWASGFALNQASEQASQERAKRSIHLSKIIKKSSAHKKS